MKQPTLAALAALAALLGACASESTPEAAPDESTAITTEGTDNTERPTTTTTGPTTTTRPTTTTTEPPPEPITLDGAGQDVVDLSEPVQDPYLARLRHDGSSNFQVALLDVGGERSEGLVNHIGHYEGVVPANFLAGRSFQFVEVNADGGWTITFEPIPAAPVASLADGYTGTGDEVVIVFIDGPTPVQVTCDTCESNFQVSAWGERRRGLINEIGAFSGRVLLPADTALIAVHAGWRRDAPPPQWAITGG